MTPARTITVDGLAVTDAGEGPIVLFLHGIGSSRAAFDPQIAALADRFRCVCPDAPGYASSVDRPMDGIDSYAAAFEALVGELEQRGPVGVVGVSFGGVVATRMARRARIDVGALVLADTSPGSGVSPGRARAMLARSDELDEVGTEAFASARAERLLSPSADPSLVDRVRHVMASSIRQPGYGHAVAAMAASDLRHEYPHLTCPTLVLVGEHDGVCPPAVARSIAGAIRSAQYVEIPGAGHLANQERPERFNELVGSFLITHLDPSRNGART